jgi:hemoglobin
MRDIETREDIEIIVRQFYTKVQANETLAPFFAHLNWEKHLPTMYSFWSSLLLGEQGYRGNPFQAHVSLALADVHFRTWLRLFKSTVDENYSGSKCDEIKMRAEAIAGVFQHKLGIVKTS